MLVRYIFFKRFVIPKICEELLHFMYSTRDMFAKHNNFHYYTLYSLSVFSLAKSLQLILEISPTYILLVSYLLADN